MNTCKCLLFSKMHGVEGRQYAKTHLRELKVDSANWQILYVCPVTGRYWKEYYPHSEAHGGGPSDFMQISTRQMKQEFQIDTSG